ncbi:hypothetical protein FD755_022920 [Muntiacus reevesi]|uniref:Uncharacterized protein n=1 Tax=Muntiacus reevesi TaxID=9886 RepID=A0A5N3W168_MUNRE|nr:hypothetical protein FD755_022920 [Muntiacus reevesi]
MHLKSLVEVVGVVVLVSHNIVLRNGSETFDSWKKPPLPVYTQFYFFNVTNPEEILNGETPRLEEVGPYTYSNFPHNLCKHLSNKVSLYQVKKKIILEEADRSFFRTAVWSECLKIPS